MEWLSQCVAYVKETLPPGTIVSEKDRHAKGNKRQHAVASEFVAQENGKRRKVLKERDGPPAPRSAGPRETSLDKARPPPQYSWFHPSHPLREDPRVTARRYNSGYDLESDAEGALEHHVERTEAHLAGTGERRLKSNGNSLKERPSEEQEPVNYDRVTFAEQVLKPIYHSPYPEIKPDQDNASFSSRRTAQVDDAPSHNRITSSRRSVPEPRYQPQLVSKRGPDGHSKTINGGTPLRKGTPEEEPQPLTTKDPTSTSIIQQPESSANGHSIYRPSHQQSVSRLDSAINHEPSTDPIPELSDTNSLRATRTPRAIDDQDYSPQNAEHPRPSNAPRSSLPAKRQDSRPADNEEPARPPRRIKLIQGQTQNASVAIPAAPRSLWVCDRCFKYMPLESAYVTHTKSCAVNFPPGRKVYEKANWGIWEIDGRVDKLYCQNLSLFGKLFIDHKSICFDVESFHYYVLTDSHPRRDHVIAYFCKEKFSIDDFNLATILVFPHVQQSGFGRLLMEFSYHLTKNSPTPGTPERPLSVLGARSYESLWMAMLVRYLITRLLEQEDQAPKGRGKKVDTYMRVWERRKKVIQHAKDTDDYLNYEDLKATKEELERQEDQLPLTGTMTVEELAHECNLKTDDLLCLLDALGVFDHRRLPRPQARDSSTQDPSASERAQQALAKQLHLKDWSRTQVTIDFELVVKITGTWRIPAKPLLDPACCWIEYTGGPLCKPVPKKNYVGYM